MKNFIFISPNFPVIYWKFCHELKNNGLRVLGIGDCPYEQLLPELQNVFSEGFRTEGKVRQCKKIRKGRLSDLWTCKTVMPDHRRSRKVYI